MSLLDLAACEPQIDTLPYRRSIHYHTHLAVSGSGLVGRKVDIVVSLSSYRRSIHYHTHLAVSGSGLVGRKEPY